MENLFKKNCEKIIIDVSDTEFIDSHGVGIIVYYHTLMRKSNRDLVLLNTDPNPVSYMTRLFEMTNLNKVLNVVSRLDDIWACPAERMLDWGYAKIPANRIALLNKAIQYFQSAIRNLRL